MFAFQFIFEWTVKGETTKIKSAKELYISLLRESFLFSLKNFKKANKMGMDVTCINVTFVDANKKRIETKYMSCYKCTANCEMFEIPKNAVSVRICFSTSYDSCLECPCTDDEESDDTTMYSDDTSDESDDNVDEVDNDKQN